MESSQTIVMLNWIKKGKQEMKNDYIRTILSEINNFK